MNIDCLEVSEYIITHHKGLEKGVADIVTAFFMSEAPDRKLLVFYIIHEIFFKTKDSVSLSILTSIVNRVCGSLWRYHASVGASFHRVTAINTVLYVQGAWRTTNRWSK